MVWVLITIAVLIVLFALFMDWHIGKLGQCIHGNTMLQNEILSGILQEMRDLRADSSRLSERLAEREHKYDRY